MSEPFQMPMSIHEPSRSIPSPAAVDLHAHQRDDGMYELGFDDRAVGPLPSWLFAQAIAN